jgi:hypothetical protein
MSYHFTSGMTHSNLIRLLLLEKTRTIQLGISHLKSLLFYQPNYLLQKEGNLSQIGKGKRVNYFLGGKSGLQFDWIWISFQRSIFL